MSDDPRGTDRPEPEPHDPAEASARADDERPTFPGPGAGVDRTARPRPGGYMCDICGSPMLERHCKILCPVCGYQRDCSDP